MSTLTDSFSNDVTAYDTNGPGNVFALTYMTPSFPKLGCEYVRTLSPSDSTK